MDKRNCRRPDEARWAVTFIEAQDHEHKRSSPVLYKRYHLVYNVGIYKKGQNAYEINDKSS